MRRLWALLRGLPPTGALGRSVGEHWPSETVEELLATLCELVDFGNRVTLKAWGGRPGKPVRVPRPGEGRPVASGVEANALLNTLMGGG